MDIKKELEGLHAYFGGDDDYQVIDDEEDDEDVDFDREFHPEPSVSLEKKVEAQMVVEPTAQQNEPKTMKEAVMNLVSSMPADKQAAMYKLFFEMGLNEDDYLFTYAYVLGHVNLMYKEIPDALTRTSEALKKQSMSIEPTLRRIVNDEIVRLRAEFEKRTELMVSAQVEVSQQFQDNAELYMQAVKKTQDNLIALTDSVTEQYKAKILDTMAKSLHKELPKIVSEHLKSVKEENTNQKIRLALYGVGLVTSGVVFGNVIMLIFRSIAGWF